MAQVQLDGISDVQNAKKYFPLALGVNGTANDNYDIHWCFVHYVGLSLCLRLKSSKSAQLAMYSFMIFIQLH